jgi:hypothetical protein
MKGVWVLGDKINSPLQHANTKTTSHALKPFSINPVSKQSLKKTEKPAKHRKEPEKHPETTPTTHSNKTVAI